MLVLVCIVVSHCDLCVLEGIYSLQELARRALRPNARRWLACGANRLSLMVLYDIDAGNAATSSSSGAKRLPGQQAVNASEAPASLLARKGF